MTTTKTEEAELELLGAQKRLARAEAELEFFLGTMVLLAARTREK